MKRKIKMNAILALAAMLSWTGSLAQSAQTIRGRVVDDISKEPLIGVSIAIKDANVGTVSDAEGNYRIDNIPFGRQTVVISYIGYEPQTLANIVVTAGKEVVLNVSLTEQVNTLDEVVITSSSSQDKTATNNELAISSARSFNVDDTKRYAGALGDPSRMAANFAGVIGGDDSRNDIVVRGKFTHRHAVATGGPEYSKPKSLWRIEQHRGPGEHAQQ
jgi:hypothetical protein